MGSSFGYLLKDKFDIKGICNKHYSSSREAVDKIGMGRPLQKTQIKEILPKIDLVMITTPDDQIKEMAEYVLQGNLGKPVCLMHMSGLYTSEILNEKKHSQVYAFSLHPLQAIPSFARGIKLLPGAFFALEGAGEGLKYGRKLAESLQLNYEVIAKKYKPLYHAAAVIASNYLVTLMAASYDLLDEADLLQPAVKSGIINLVQGTLSNIAENDPSDALTGPIARGDIETISLHLEALKKFKPEYEKLYQILGKYTADIKGDTDLKQFFDTV